MNVATFILAVLMAKQGAIVANNKLQWTCTYATENGKVVVVQPEECEPVRMIPRT